MGANHARVLNELPDAELVAVCDSDEATLQGFVEARCYLDYRELLETEQLDGVSVAVPTRKHLEIALAAIERGIPLLVEKPLGADLDECLRLRDAADRMGVPLMVGHVERFNPVVQALKQRLASGDAGRIYQAYARRVGPFFQRERDVGVVHDLATHDIDILHHLFGPVERVHGETQTGLRTPYEDALSSVLRFEGGVTALLEVNWLTPLKFRDLHLLGEQGRYYAVYHPQVLQFWRAGAPGDEPRVDSQTFPGSGEAPLANELSAFLRVARRDIEPPVTADDAIAAMRVVEALIESARSGETVRLAGRAAT
jgi:predicted dehydrogenase